MSTRARQAVIWAVTITRDSVLWGLGVWMIWFEVRHGQPGNLRLEVLLLGVGLVTGPIGLAAWAARHGIGTSGSPSLPPQPPPGPPSEQPASTSGR